MHIHNDYLTSLSNSTLNPSFLTEDPIYSIYRFILNNLIHERSAFFSGGVSAVSSPAPSNKDIVSLCRNTYEHDISLGLSRLFLP